MPVATVMLRFHISTNSDETEVPESCISVAGIGKDDHRKFMANVAHFQVDENVDDLLVNTEDYEVRSQRISSSRSYNYPSGTKKTTPSPVDAILFAKATECLNYLDKEGYVLVSSTVDSVVLKESVCKSHVWTLKSPLQLTDRNKDDSASEDSDGVPIKRKKRSH